jgi:hypothetical protein
MTDYREIERLKADPSSVRATAIGLAQTASDLTDWETDFLIDMRRVQHPISTRQAEKLVQIRDDRKRFTSIDGFSVPTLIAKCMALRFDLDAEADEAFVARLADRRDVNRPEAVRLVRIARELGELEQHHGRAL